MLSRKDISENVFFGLRHFSPLKIALVEIANTRTFQAERNESFVSETAHIPNNLVPGPKFGMNSSIAMNEFLRDVIKTSNPLYPP